MTATPGSFLTRHPMLTALLAALLLAPAPVGADGLSGHVLGPGGAPLAGATIEVVPQLGRWERLRHRLDGTEPSVAARTVSGDDGRFELPAQPPGLWTLQVRADGMFPAERQLATGPEIAGPQRVHLLPATERFVLRVVDSAGSPVAGAEIDAMIQTLSSDRWRHQRMVHATTTADGTVEMATPGGKTYVFATARRLLAGDTDDDARTWITEALPTSLAAATASGSMTIHLPAESDLRRVRFVCQGRPLAGVAVVDYLGPRAIADDQGLALVQPPAENRQGGLGAWIVTADAIVPWPSLPTDSTSRDGSTRSSPPVDIEVPPAVELAGRVVSADGTPIQDAWIAGLFHSLGEPFLAFSGRDGGFLVPEASSYLTVRAEGYFPARLDTSIRGVESNSLPDLVLQAAVGLTAWIVDEGRQPVAGVQVEVLNQQARQSGLGDSGLGIPATESEPALSDEGGMVRLAGLLPDARLLVRLRHRDFADTKVEAVVPGVLYGSSRDEPTWVLAAGVRVSGRTVDGDGEPLAGVSVALVPRSVGNLREHLSYLDGIPETVESDASGRYAFARVAAGAYRLEASGADGGRATRLVEISQPGPVELDDVVLSDAATLRGRVRDAAGIPIGGVTVFANTMDGSLPGSGPTPHGITAADGTFQITGLSDDRRVSVSGHHERYRVESVDAQPPFPEVLELVARPANRVSGRVVDEEGRPVGRAQLAISVSQMTSSSGSTASITGQLEPDGRFEQSDLGPGSLRITVTAADGRSASYQAELNEGDALEGIELVLRAGVDVAGWVGSADGEPVVGSTVFLAPAAAGAMARHHGDAAESLPGARRTRTDADGRFRFANVQPASTLLAVIGASHPTYRDEILVGAAGVTDLEILVARNLALDGIVSDDLGRPLAAARIESMGPSGRIETISDAEGRFTLTHCDPGAQWTLRVRQAGGPGCVVFRPEQRIVDGILQLTVPAPVADVEVRLLGLDDAALARVRIDAWASDNRDWSCSTEARAESDGSALIPSLGAGRWRVEAHAGQISRQQTVNVDIGAGSPTVTFDFAEGLELAGTILVDGAPLPNLSLRLEGDGGLSYSGPADATGSFRITGIEPGRYRLELQAGLTEFRHALFLDLVADEELRLDLATSVLRGRVTPPSRAIVQLRQGEVTVRAGVFPSGEFVLRTALSGAARLEAYDGAARASAEVTLVPGTVIEVADVVLAAPQPCE